MKPTIRHSTACIAFAAALILGQNAMAYTGTDLFLEVSDPGTNGNDNASKTYALDLGSASSLTSGETWNVAADLTTIGNESVFSTDWQTANASWEVVGSDSNENEFLSTSSPSTAAAGGDPSGFANIVSQRLLSGMNSGTLGSASNSYFFSSKYAEDFGNKGGGFAGGSSSEALIADDNNQNQLPDSLSLVEIEASNGSFDAGATTLGIFTLGNNGVVTYEAAAVPEPTSLSLALMGGALFFIYRRRAMMLRKSSV